MGENSKTFALITGASKGLGKAFALQLAMRNINLILVSLPGEDLKILADEIKATGVEAIPYETDLGNLENITELCNWVNANYKLEILINNAGIGGTSRFLEVNSGILDKIIQINVKATALLTHQLLPNLLERSQSYVLNVASLAALSPIPYKTVYPASKAFVHSFTRGLQKEFSGTGVSFSVLNPGPMETNEEVIETTEKNGYLAKLIHLYPEKVAEISINKMFKKHKIIRLNWLHRISLLCLNLPAEIKMTILGGIFKKGMQKGESA